MLLFLQSYPVHCIVTLRVIGRVLTLRLEVIPLNTLNQCILNICKINDSLPKKHTKPIKDYGIFNEKKQSLQAVYEEL